MSATAAARRHFDFYVASNVAGRDPLVRLHVPLENRFHRAHDSLESAAVQ